MAAIATCSIPATIRSSSGPAPSRKPDPDRNRSVSWWAPLFGVSPDPDYMNPKKAEPEGPEREPALSKARFAPGCFTEAKAKHLRRKMAESSSFHDIMYHSAIASRLASDLSGRAKN